MNITSKGQVTIPQAFRKRYGLLPRTAVRFVPGKEGLVIKPALTVRERAEQWVRQARGRATRRGSTDEILRGTRGDDG